MAPMMLLRLPKLMLQHKKQELWEPTAPRETRLFERDEQNMQKHVNLRYYDDE